MDHSCLMAISDSIEGPAYVYFLDVVQERCRVLRSSLSSSDPLVLYAMKANSSRAVIQALLPHVDGLECVSLGEVMLAIRLGARRVLYTNSNVSPAELEQVLALSRSSMLAGTAVVWINCDSMQRISELPEGSSVFLRINGPLGAGHHAHVITCGPDSKFGIFHTDIGAALELALVCVLAM